MFKSTVIFCSPRLGAALILGLGYSASSLADHAQESPDDMLEITIEGGIEAATSVYRVDPEVAPETPDTATLLQRAPGANVNRNGPLTGIAQYRGMFGHRVNALVDGMSINSGGPNGMDPPLSCIPRSQLGSLTVIRGIAPVSSGAETIGGTILAT
jgi:outer membrane cobalamin receptor